MKFAWDQYYLIFFYFFLFSYNYFLDFNIKFKSDIGVRRLGEWDKILN